jgi:electron transfer flavoprotein beta subunit
VPDPEIPLVKFRIDPEAKRIIPPVISPFDGQAIEAALRIKEQHEGKITVLTMGSGSAGDVVKHALSMGADEGIIVSDEAFEGSDIFSSAYVLTKAIEKIGKYDLILCGRQAADWDIGAVGSLIAENLEVSIITLARKIELVNGTLRVERVLMEGYDGGAHRVYVALLDHNGMVLYQNKGEDIGPLEPIPGTGSWKAVPN